jgi:uncharacterized protein (DUF1800 family)
MTLDPSDVAHLMRRAGFTTTTAETAAIAAATPDRATLVNQICAPSAPVPAALPALNGTAWTWTDMVLVRNWWMERFRTAPNPLAEKITLFWHSFFATRSCGFAARDADLVDLYRTKGFGKYRDLLQAVAIHPAMLDYLGARSSTKWSPNQNFARELLELYTIGAGNYTQADVVGASRAWTGWRVDEATGAVTFDPTRADNGTKTFLGSSRDWDGPEIIDRLCSDATTRAQIAARLSYKMWAFFGTPDATPEARKAVADTLTATELDIRAGLTALFNHPEFWAATTRNGLVRTPVEYVVAALRALNITAQDASPGNWRVDMQAMGQELFYAPNVGGWPTNIAWLTPSANLARQAFAHWLSTFVVGRGTLDQIRALDIEPAAQLIADTFGIADRLTAPTRAALTGFLKTQRAAPSSTDGGADIRGLITIAILSPEFTLA